MKNEYRVSANMQCTSRNGVSIQSLSIMFMVVIDTKLSNLHKNQLMRDVMEHNI